MPTQTQFTIAPATVADVPSIYDLVMELAEYEKLRDTVLSTVKDFEEALFGENPSAECLVAFVDAQAVGVAFYFTNYSTFMGRPGMYLEDIYVKPALRGKGIGKAFLQQLAQIAKERGYRRMEWAVLDWNKPAIDFYESIGAQPLSEWTVYRMTTEAIDRLASGEIWD